MTPGADHADGSPSRDRRDRLRALGAAGRARLAARLGDRREERITGAEAVIRSLAGCGIRWIAGVAGTPVDALFDHAARLGMRPIGMRTQAGAAFLAGAAGWWSGRLEGAVVVSAGPAVANTLTGLLVARDNGWPLLVLGGSRSLAARGTGQFQEWHAPDTLGTVVKWTATARTASEIPGLIRAAVGISLRGRPGPVFIDLPEDVLVGTMVPDAGLLPVGAEVADEPPPTLDVRAVVDELGTARRPVLVLGEGCRWTADLADLRSWIEACGLPVACLGALRGILPDGHPLAVQRIRSEVLARADCVLVVVARIDWRLRFGAERHSDARWIRVDWDAGAGEVIPPGGRGVDADPGWFLGALQREWGARSPWPADPWEDWRAEIAERSGRRRAAPSVPVGSPVGPLALAAAVDAVRRALPPGATVVLDGNLTLETGRRRLEASLPLRWMEPGWNGCMGAGLLQGMAACLTRPGEPVVVLTGDFSLGLSLVELETAARHGLRPCVVVIHNGGNTGGFRQRDRLPAGHPERVHAYLPEVRHDQVAAALGWDARRIESAGELADTLRAAIDSGKPCLLDVVVDPFSGVPESPGDPEDGR